jgi:hypothetical protein
MKMPHAHAAVVDVGKLLNYVLNPAHPEGRHKARVFAAALGIDQRDADWLAAELRMATRDADFEMGTVDAYGARFACEVVLTRQHRSATVRAVWMIRKGEELARLVTCFVV